MPTNMVTDHSGKISQGRVSALAGLGVAGALALGPWWGAPTPDFDVLCLFVLGPSGLGLWQKLGAPAERIEGDRNGTHAA